MRGFLTAAVTVLSATVFNSQAKSETPSLSIPTLEYEYSYGIDLYCPDKLKFGDTQPVIKKLIKQIPDYQKELAEDLLKFQAAWDDLGAKLTYEAITETGIPFERDYYAAAIFVCPTLPSIGTPLSINSISYLKSAAKDIPGLSDPKPKSLFVSITFHELFHKYVNDILKRKPSKIMAALKGKVMASPIEDDLVLAHLHVFALQKLAFERTGNADMMPAVKAQEATYGKAYQRAWAMVHDEGYYEALLEELRDTKQTD